MDFVYSFLNMVSSISYAWSEHTDPKSSITDILRIAERGWKVEFAGPQIGDLISSKDDPTHREISLNW